ncbi:MAG TPA: hypothetical protein PLP65_01015 [Bacteroidales bacterium]|nr:hypothetical protein [Bacteroidales bacterium]
MKKLFLVILVGGMIFTACKKEEVKKNYESVLNKNVPCWPPNLPSNFVLINTDSIIDGISYRQYIDSSDSTYVFFENYPTNDKALFRRYRWDAYFLEHSDGSKTIACGGEPLKECYNTATGTHVKYGASLE